MSSLDVQGTRLQYADTINTTAAGLSPSVRVDWDRAVLGAWGTYAQLGTAWSADGAVRGSAFTPNRGPFSGELSTTLGGSTHRDGTHTGSAMALARLHVTGARSGAWLGGGAGGTWDGRTWRSLREGDMGVWLSNGPAALTVSVQPALVDDSIRYTDFSANGSLRRGIYELEGVAGARAGSRLPAVASDARAWASVSAAVWVLPRVALIASGGTYPVDYTQGFPGGKFVSAGVRIALSRRSNEAVIALPIGVEAASDDVTGFELVPAGRGTRALRVRAPGARLVEISGDFTHWQPRRLTPAANGWYTIVVPIAPGTYQMSVRVDGRP
ncbi:MAG TPA: glycogen-binding domain-containing protein, partial [Candidatus Elarobacter sp.]|nr:glycogen-binding domain-containing protein [Candidatus Elarobacter sp.]